MAVQKSKRSLRNTRSRRSTKKTLFKKKVLNNYIYNKPNFCENCFSNGNDLYPANKYKLFNNSSNFLFCGKHTNQLFFKKLGIVRKMDFEAVKIGTHINSRDTLLKNWCFKNLKRNKLKILC